MEQSSPPKDGPFSGLAINLFGKPVVALLFLFYSAKKKIANVSGDQIGLQTGIKLQSNYRPFSGSPLNEVLINDDMIAAVYSMIGLNCL